jgi:hypothetical protein
MGLCIKIDEKSGFMSQAKTDTGSDLMSHTFNGCNRSQGVKRGRRFAKSKSRFAGGIWSSQVAKLSASFLLYSSGADDTSLALRLSA